MRRHFAGQALVGVYFEADAVPRALAREVEDDMASTPAKTPYRVKAESVEACSCHHGCNCQFAGFPNEGKCEFIVGFEVKDGRVGDVSLNGLRAVVAAKYPKAIHEGNGHVVSVRRRQGERRTGERVSRRCCPVSSEACRGRRWQGRSASSKARFENPSRSRSPARSRCVRVPGSIELQLTPLRDVVSGEEKEVHIVYPKGGFFWDDGKIATTEAMRAKHGDFGFEWPARYAAAAEVHWSNQ